MGATSDLAMNEGPLRGRERFEAVVPLTARSDRSLRANEIIPGNADFDAGRRSS